MSEKMLLLMVEDFAEIKRCRSIDVYSVHPMDTLDDFKQSVIENFSNGNVKEYKPFGIDQDFDFDSEWFVSDNNIVKSLPEKELSKKLEEDKEEIVELYHKLEEEYAEDLINNNEIRTELLKKYVYEDNEYPEGNILYMDMNLESIADFLSEVMIRDLIGKLHNVTVTSWMVVKSDDIHYLVES